MPAVYVIAAEGGPVKVGIADSPERRVRQLATGTPASLRLAHVEQAHDLRALDIEAAAHALLSASRVRGEWFAVTVEQARDAIRQAIADLRAPAVAPESGGTRSERVVALLTPEERKAFVAWMLAQGERSESAMVRRLMLEASGQVEPKGTAR